MCLHASPGSLPSVDAILKRFAALVFAVLAGCSTLLPTINPDMADPKPVVLETGRGPLSAAQSNAILEQLKSRGSETSIFDRHLALEEGIAASPLVVGNKVTLLQNGPATYQAMFDPIKAAKQHVNLEPN